MQEKLENNTLHLIPFSYEVFFRAIQSDLNFEAQAKAKINHNFYKKQGKKLLIFRFKTRPGIFRNSQNSAHEITY